MAGGCVRLSSESTPGADDWLTDLAPKILSPAEQAELSRLPSSHRRRSQWLAGRLAAKDVARRLLGEAARGVAPTDIVISAAPSGAPRVSLAAAVHLAHEIVITIAHTDSLAVAMGAEAAQVRGVGIDVEWCTARRSLERKGLTPAERAALVGVPAPSRAELALRIWTAKEATAKALGTGLDLLGGAQAIRVTLLTSDGSELAVDVDAAAAGGRRRLLARSVREGDLVFATVVDLRADG